MNICAAFNNCVFYGCSKLLNFVISDDGIPIVKIISKLASLITICLFVFGAFFTGRMALFVVIPGEFIYAESIVFFSIRVFLALWFYFSVVFHYLKTRTANPVKNPGKPGDKFCLRCNMWKGEETHHCSACDRCIWKMDHHCPHMGQCIGAHNQAHFFLFLVNMFCGSLLSLLMAPNFWHDHFLNVLAKQQEMSDDCTFPICVNVWLKVMVLSYSNTRNITLLFLLLVGLSISMFAFIATYSVMISGGRSFLMKRAHKIPKTPWTLRLAIRRFRQYLGMMPDESFLALFFIPKSRNVSRYMDNGSIEI